MIIFGLGNPGLKYRATRHNTGYIFLERMAKVYKKRFQPRSGYKIAKIRIASKNVNLVKPICWMNQSGLAIAEILQERDNDFLVILDDLNLPLGKIRLKGSGSDGGHLGLRSIINSLNSSTFPRLRIGIGPPNQDAVSYVLSPFESTEKKILRSVIEKAIEGIEILLKQGLVRAQNFMNSIKIELDSNGQNKSV